MWPYYDLEERWLERARAMGYVDALGERVLPSGVKLGHRSLRRAYVQSYRTDDTRLSVLAARRNLLRARIGGMRGTAFVGRLGGGGGGGGGGEARAVWASHGQLLTRLALRQARA